MRRLSIKEYVKKLTLFHALSKTRIKISKPIKAILKECQNTLISVRGEHCSLAKNVRCVVIAKLEKVLQTDQEISYKLMLIEAFFLPLAKSSVASNEDSIRTRPYIYFVTLTSKKPLQLYDLLLIKVKQDSKKYQSIPKSDYKKVMQLELQYKHSLHAIIYKNLHYANTNQYVANIEKDVKRHNHVQPSNTAKHICMITERRGKVVAQALNARMILPVKATQKALKMLPKFTLVAVNGDNQIVEVLGSLLQGKQDKEISLYVNDYAPKDFSQKALSEAENMATSLINTESVKLPKNHIKKQLDTTLRYDLTHLPFCTIDPINAKDHDDAIYYDSKNSILYVAIADVGSYVPMDSVLDKEAREKAFSLYFPNEVFPMLPPSLSAHACSLKPNENRLALTWALKLHKRNATVLHAQIFQALICSRASLHYKQVSYFLESRDTKHLSIAQAKHSSALVSEIMADSSFTQADIGIETIKNQAIRESLLAFSKLAVLLYKKRMKNGIDLALRDFSIKVDDNEELESITLENKEISHMLVEEAMLLANQASAMYLHTIQHGIYRNHAAPNKRDFYKLLHVLSHINISACKRGKKHKKVGNNILFNLQALQKEAIRKDKRHIVDFCIVRHFAKANYMSNNIGHFGLGFSSYAHFTSPIRRYSDLLAHRLITAHLQNDTKALQYIIRETKTILAHINKREVQFDSIESYYKRLKMLRYAQNILPFNDEALVFMVRKNIAYGFPLHQVGYCSVEIACQDCLVNMHEVVQIQINDVDFNTLSLKAVLIHQTCNKIND